MDEKGLSEACLGIVKNASRRHSWAEIEVGPNEHSITTTPHRLRVFARIICEDIVS